MGTSYHIVLVGRGNAEVATVSREIQRRLDWLDQTLTTYDENSELNRLNRGRVGETTEISPELWDILQLAQEIYRQSDGAFDPTVGPLVDLWGFGPVPGSDRVPAEQDIARARGMVGFDAVELQENYRVVRHRPVRLDLSAIAKGYAVDDVARLVAQHGWRDYMIEIGGELYLSGRNAEGTPWRIAVESPGLDGQPADILGLSQVAVATSGDYRNYFERDGQRYSHTIDPQTGRPITHDLASVTVLAATAARADALATAFDVMGAERALELAERDGIAVLVLRRQGSTFVEQRSRSFARKIRPVN